MIQQVPLQRLVEVVVRCQVGRVGMGYGHGGGGGRAGDTGHGMVGDVRLEWVAFAVRHNVSSRQSFCAGQQTLIKAAEYIALKLQARMRMEMSVGNTVNSGFKNIFEHREPSSKHRS